jgi:hypothetical protein
MKVGIRILELESLDDHQAGGGIDDKVVPIFPYPRVWRIPTI